MKKAFVLDVYETTDYKELKPMPGNRPIDKTHVQELIKRFIDSGNFTKSQPVVVNKDNEIVDGQHRVKALEELGWPVYLVAQDENINHVIGRNTGNKNWSWYNFAVSYAERGNEAYKQFLDLYKHFVLSYSIISYYVSGKNRQRFRDFRDGLLEVPDYSFTFKLLTQYRELVEAARHDSRVFAIVLYEIMRNPNYDHERMVEKLRRYGAPLTHCYLMSDYKYALDDIYNKNEPVRTRLS